ncbi:MAG: DNA polymerase II [Candidatus Rokubacteria bacterium]|nr:DNA polymerase II [Candidatus Rokubacteria bacterium]
MRLYRRSPSGIAVETDAFAPFLLAAEEVLLAGADGLVDLVKLDGPGAFRWLARFGSWSAALAARDRCRQASGRGPGAADAPYHFLPDPVHQYLLSTGRTSFGGMTFKDLRRLALDIEVVTTEGYDFPNAAREGDRIVAVGLADSGGFSHVIRGDRMGEAELLAECTRIIRERDPDVLEGHNIFRFDLEYLEARSRRHGVSLAWGRDGSALRGRYSRLQIAERTLDYRRYDVAGRAIVDTWMLAQLFDVGARDLPSFGLKDIARHFGVAAPDRTYVDASAIARELREAPDRLMAYAADDALETLRISEILSPPYFAQAQLVPFDYQSAMLRGSAAKVDALLMRAYLHERQAVPAPRPGTAVGGGYVALFREGVARPVLHADVTSLYPSLMLASGIAPASDHLGAFPTLLAHLRDVRVDAKRRMQAAATADERAHWAALSQSFKILINSFYGYLAFGHGHWNDFDAANRVTSQGQGVIRAIIDRLGELGAVVVEADTDGVYFVPPPQHAPPAHETLLERVAPALPAGIQLELEERYAAMFSYKAKTYALLDDRGRVTLRGSGFRSRGLEPFQRRLIEEVIGLLLTGRAPEVRLAVDRWLDDFAHRRVPVKLFARTETLGESLEAYREKIRAGARNPSAGYELACASGRPWQPGDQIAYYVAGRGASVAVNERARLVTEWDPAAPDENVEYYQAKVREIWDRFRAFTEDTALRPPAPEADPAAQLNLF